MCRHIGYLGPPAAVGEILTRGAHSLRTQAWAPSDMRRGGTINADGFGVAWWVPVVAPPAGDTDVGDVRVTGRIGGRAPIALPASRYRNPAPIWTDPAVDEVLPQLRSTSVLGAVRSATVGMPVERSACAPFTHGRWAFSHNGVIPDWRRVLSTVAAQFGAPDLLTAEAATDSAALWVIVCAALSGVGCSNHADDRGPGSSEVSPVRARSRIRDGAANGAPEGAVPPAGTAADVVSGARAAGAEVVADILAAVVCAVLAQAPDARLNLLLSDGETLWATTVYHSLSVLVADDFATVASEPYDDDPRWQPVADRQLLTVRPGYLTITSLDTAAHPLSAGPDESERARS